MSTDNAGASGADAGDLCEWCEGSGVLEGYGGFPGGDPRNFYPDGECSTDKELAAHAEACAAWNRGERPEADREHCEAAVKENGGMVLVHHGGSFGLGVYRMTPCPACGKEAAHV